MRHIVTGLVDKPADAQKIIDDLVLQCLCDREDIGIMAGDRAGGGMATQAARTAGHMAQAAAGAAATALSTLFGFGSSVVSREVSGFGVLSAAGQLGVKLSRVALTGAQDIAKALVDAGVQAELARSHAEALREGKILLVVDAKTDNMAHCARKTLNAHGAMAPEDRVAQ